MPSTTLSVLFTDLVGSTELLTRLGPTADDLRRSHFVALRGAVAAHRGEEIKSLGDGLMVAFTSAADALGCGVTMQQAVDRLNRRQPTTPLSIRVGVSAGDVTREDGDLFGQPVVEAARLCDAADGDAILVSDLVLALAGASDELPAESLGHVHLRGFDRPVAVSTVRWSPLPGGPLPLPPALDLADQPSFVGREAALDRLHQLWDAATTGTRQAVLVAGEPGIGKTRLAVELARSAHAAGATVLYGRCEEGLGAAYQPFTEAVRHYVAHCWLEQLAAYVQAHGGDLGRLVPELAQRLPDVPVSQVVEPELYRVRLFEAVTDLLRFAARETPVVLVIDDLHWAARPTLLMLRHVLGSDAATRLLVIATYRDTQLGPGHPLTETLGEVRGRAAVEQLTLGGLARDDVTAFVQLAAGHHLDDRARALALALHAQTDGNPFFVAEILRHLVETGAVYRREGVWVSDLAIDDISLPEGIRATVGGRLSHVSETARRALSVGSVVGREFDLAVVELVAGGDGEDLLDAFDEGVGARLIAEVPGLVGRFTFSHALVWHTLYEELTAARRARLHRRVGEALEALHPGHLEEHLPSLARHFGEAASQGQARKAADYARLAAERALQQAAHEDATGYLEQALSVLEQYEPSDVERRCDLLLAMARARALALDHTATRETSLAAAELARSLGSGERLSRAAYWYNARGVVGSLNEAGIALCEEALASLGDEVPALRAMVLGTLARERAFAGAGIAAEPEALEALELARTTGDDAALAVALTAHYYSVWGTERVAEQLARANELLPLSAVTQSGLVASNDAHRLRAVPLFMLGDRTGFEAEVEELARYGEQLRSPYCQGLAVLWRAALAFLDGRFAEVEPLANEALGICSDDANFQNSWAGQMFHLHGETGRLDEIKPLVAAMVDQNPGLAAFRAALAYTHASLGELDDARRHFEVLAADDFDGVPRDLLWPASLGLMSEACVLLDDRIRAGALSGLFRRHAGLLVVAAGGSHCMGAVDRYLGMLASTDRRWAAAEGHFDAALELEEGLGSEPLTARTRHWYGRMLLARDGPGDRSKASELFSRSLETAERLGMEGLVIATRDLASVA